MPGQNSKPRSPSVQAPPDTPPVAGQPQAPVFFGILLLAGLVIIGVGLKSTASIVAPVFLVLTLVITVAPLRRFLVRHRWPSPLASLVSLLAIYALVIVILGSVVWSVFKLVEKLPDYATAFNRIFQSLLGVADRLGYGQEQIQKLAGSFQLTSLAGPAQTLLSGVTSFGSLLVLIVAVVIFMAFDQADIGERLALIRRTRPHIADGLQNFADRVRKYWVVTTIFGLIVAVLDTVALLIIGVPLALTWGVLAFVTNYIPNIGFVLGVIPPALIALLDGGPGSALAVVIVYTALNVIIQTIIQPRFTGDAVGISGTVAFISLIFWAYLLGGLGALLAIPATLFLKSTLLDNSVPASWLSALISSSPKKDQPQTPRKLAGASAQERPAKT
ncbi:Predicted PurR-regulated permease PerM [Microlunatus sagamiharensis]|uniref:Predicted PurR-regulated permease PerM n=1 Tax=Microlunatus sagamiharensis TaxID=546874 RepID=A0A1H2M6D2_9ACTN|nr:AI-2E family transporter [Microlunatus sagamiharensis]SDU88674.1 Predicted PurR-regulated permease PerM [Microlunatus sagamiharensis]